METIAVLLAAVASFAVGAFWYGMLAGAWIRASGVATGEDGKPANATNPMLYVGTFLLQLIVAGMMRHVMATAGLDSIGAGIMVGAGVGLCFITPWIGINNAYQGRPVLLSAIDGGYATLGCTAMGAVLGLLG